MLCNVYYFFTQNPSEWSIIVEALFLQTESLHYPILYTALNKTLRRELKTYVKNWYHKMFNKNGSTTTQIIKITVPTTRL
uniref:Uncharacterized protein n=1 Tax=Acrobeloides nanus TaxID=290746 RepID=A0A914D2C2_9BILA